ncbi:sodium- and chloride-dependent glycine transporter 2-like [Oppia nitens]|uniref:sodium- and chloride-dependent glycine transporter 2-like n=1 Tax=Oppia nitens TaxID=1686743 RepID=UPI0023DAAD7F|nr:sodium- and chloride-dependent glycine transporter 2-like [Oppia nitens]
MSIESSFERNCRSRASIQQTNIRCETTIKSRDGWDNKWEFFFSCVGLSVGIGNVWRFPYLAYENGGGAFLIPYLIMLALVGKPIYFLELALGQFGGTGPLSIWRCTPIAKGIGVAMIVVSLVICIYYNVVMSYTLYFIAHSFQSELSWQRCDPEWSNDTNCTVRSKNTTILKGLSSSQIFWERKVLDLSPGIDQLNGVKWDLALCLAISWLIVILCLIKGIKTSGKVVYFAATFPYVILISLLIVGITQTGAWEGIKYFIVPDWGKLLEIQVWRAAAGQMFFSLGVGMGGLIMLSSYNDFRHNIFHDAMIVSILDTITSIISGLVIFSVLGAMANDLGPDVKVSDVVKSGPGLAFVTYPEALTRLPFPQIWSVLFFLMLFLLGLDTEFAVLENVLTSFSDEIPFLRKHKLKFCVVTGIVCFSLGLPCVTRGGQYIFNLMDNYGGSIPLVFIGVFECIALMWIYGFDRFAFDMDFMLGKQLGLYWKIMWKYTSPIILSFILVYMIINFKPLKYGEYDYPDWADALGICLTLVIILQVPIWAIYAIYSQNKGQTFREKIELSLINSEDWGPRDLTLRHEWKTKYANSLSIGYQINKEPVVLMKCQNITKKTNNVNNPAFISDIS